MKLLKFELKKSWRRKQYILLLLLVVVCVAILFYRNVSVQDEIVNRALKDLEPHIQVALKLRADYEKAMAEREINDKLLEGYNNALAMNTAVWEWELAIRDSNWGTVPLFEQKFLQTIVQQNGYGFRYGDFQDGELEQIIEKNDFLVEHSLPYEDEMYSISTPNFMKSSSTLFLSLYGVLIFVLLLGDQMTTEIENQTIKTLYTQPIRKWRFILGKFVSMMIAVLFALVVFIVACILIPLAFGGQAGSFSYPQLVLASDGFTYISIGDYLIQHVVLFIGTIIFSFSLVLLFSFLIQNRFNTLTSVLLMLSGGVIVTNQSESLQTTLNPFFYFRFGELIERPEELGQFPNVFVLVGYSLLVLLICYIVQNNGRAIGKEKPEIRPFRAGEPIRTSSLLTSILAFEWRKLWRQGFVKQVITMLLVLIIGGYLFLTHLTNEKEQNYLSNLNGSIYEIEQHFIPKYEQEVQERQAILKELLEKEGPLTESEEVLKIQTKSFLGTYQDLLKDFHLMVESSQSQLATFQEENWPKLYSHWIDQNRYEKGEIKSYSARFMDTRPTERIGLSDFTYKVSIQEKKLLAERQLEPVFAFEYLSTIYDHYPNPLDRVRWQRETLKTDNTGLFYMYIFFDSSIFLILLGLLVFLFGAGFTAEKGRKRTLSLLVTQPLSKNTIFIGKAGISMAVAFIMALGSILLMALLGTIGNRFGDWTFPVLHYDASNAVQLDSYSGMTASEGGFHSINMGRYLVESCVLFLAALLFMIALSLLMSLFFNHMISAVTMTLAVAVSGYALSSTSALSAVAHLSPFIYLNIGKIANGEIATILTNSSIHTIPGLIVLFISSFAILVAGMMKFQKTYEGILNKKFLKL